MFSSISSRVYKSVYVKERIFLKEKLDEKSSIR